MALNATTEHDSFRLFQTSNQVPALGHTFDPDVTCECGQTWDSQRKGPTVCPLLVARLQTLEDLEREIKRLKNKVRGLEYNLEECLDIFAGWYEPNEAWVIGEVADAFGFPANAGGEG